MTDAIVFWLARPLADFALAFIATIGIGCLMVLGHALTHLHDWLRRPA